LHFGNAASFRSSPRQCPVSGHDSSRAVVAQQKLGFSPWFFFPCQVKESRAKEGAWERAEGKETAGPSTSLRVYWNRSEDYAPGDAVEVHGSIGPGKFAPIVNATFTRKLGFAPLPKPLPVTFKQLNSGDFDAQYVTLTGSIRSVGKRENSGRSKHLIVRIDSGNGTLMVTLPGDAS
jgi:hypothetical protein